MKPEFKSTNLKIIKIGMIESLSGLVSLLGKEWRELQLMDIHKPQKSSSRTMPSISLVLFCSRTSSSRIKIFWSSNLQTKFQPTSSNNTLKIFKERLELLLIVRVWCMLSLKALSLTKFAGSIITSSLLFLKKSH